MPAPLLPLLRWQPVATQGGEPNEVSGQIDLATLTLEICEEGGFTASAM